MHETQHDVRGLVRHIQSLANRKARDAHREFWIEGVRPFLRAVEAGVRIKVIVESEMLNRHGIAQKLARTAARNGVPRVRVSPELFRSVSIADHSSGIGAIVAQTWRLPRSADPTHGLCWIAAESIRSAGNLGTILRTAEAVGAAGLWVLGDGVDPFDPACVRATMGGLFSLQFIRADLRQLKEWATNHGARIIGLDGSARKSWCEPDYSTPTILLAGDERAGLSTHARRASHQLIRLPMCGSADSLNVGVAMGVAMYELVRRRELSNLQSHVH